MGAVTYTGRDSTAGASGSSCPLTESSEPVSTPPQHPPVTVRISVFFDGTGNNRTNTTARRTHPLLSHFVHLPGFGDSFDNDYTNVAKLESAISAADGADHYHHIYVEGIGTSNLGGDDIAGSALGQGSTGVVDRVNGAFESTIRQINNLRINRQSPLTIQIDTFGFSRGAAASRYFIYQVMEHESTILRQRDAQHLSYRLRNLGYNLSSVAIKFVGLFDTVAAHGRNHADDVRDLQLRSITYGEKVVHLAAADEHRVNFPLVNITSNRDVELFLPGVHSDIGGGYAPVSSEEDLVIFKIDETGFADGAKREQICLLEKDRLVNSGLYRDEELIVANSGYEIVANRQNIGNEYNRIPLKLMKEFAETNGLQFNGNITRDNPIPADLSALSNLIDSYKSSHQSQRSYNTDWHDNREILRAARHRYFHNSSHYTPTALVMEAMRPQFYSSANLYADTTVNRINGIRKRRIYSG